MDKNGIGIKTIYSNTMEGVQTQTQLRYNPRTNHIGIYTGFCKSSGWNSGIINNKKCPNYLGVTIAEQLLAKVFNHVERMPNNNKGFDVICNHGYKIDIKAATKPQDKNYWLFNIYQNSIADYFLCLAFDDRKNLNPMHIWLIPSEKVNYLKDLRITESKLDKWSKYELIDKLDKVITCCNIMKNN